MMPTVGRFSQKGCYRSNGGQNFVLPSYGPMGRDVDSLVETMKAILCPEYFMLDTVTPPVPFNEQMYNDKKKLRIGYYVEDGFMVSTPHMKRAVFETVDLLKSLGHELVTWTYPDLGRKASTIWMKAIFGDGCRGLFDLVQDDKLDGSVQALLSMSRLARNRILSPLIHLILKFVHPNAALSIPFLKGVQSVPEWHQFYQEMCAFKASVINDWEEKGIDVMICPGFCNPALHTGQNKYASGAVSYTCLYNVLGFPVGSMPVSVAKPEDTAKMKDYPENDIWHKTIKKSCGTDAEGLPLNVQVAALPWHDERILQVMKDLETALKH